MALGTIQTGLGLVSGMDIGGTVDKLIALAAKPRDMLQTKTDAVKTQQTALTTLSALLYSIKVPSESLGKATLYQERTATSSMPNALAVTVSGHPAIGSYEYTPLRMAQSQKQLSSGVVSDTQSLGKGTMTIRFGDRVDRSTALNVINGGQGFDRGTIRITDGNGSVGNIDLSTAQTVDDVLDAINGSQAINVTATAVNGHIHLVDNTGGALHLKVQDTGSRKTATSLGLAGIDSATGSADGQNILSIYNGIPLNALNDGMGVEVNPSMEDIKYTLRDGTTDDLEFAPHDDKTNAGNPESTLQQLIDEVNTQSGGKLKLEIAADGVSLKLTDTTTGTGTFTLQAEYGSRSLHDLGLDAQAVNGVVTAAADVVAGQRIMGGLKTVSLGSLNGGKGLGTLGSITLTDRAGGTDTIDLQYAQTLDDIVETINASTSVQIHAQVNRAGNGIELIDTTGSSTGSMAVADADSTNTATTLNLKTPADATALGSINSGDMHLKVIGENTLLSSLNGGAGVAAGKFKITDSKGSTATINLATGTVKTIGDVIRAINGQLLTAQAELNATGDGILLTDAAGRKLTVTESGGTTAKSLGLLHNSTTTAGGQQIDGSMTYKIDIYDKDSLQNVNAQINELGAGFSSSIISDGSAQPYHLMITSGRTGKAGAMMIDSSGVNFSFGEISKAQDSLLLLGPKTTEATGVLTSSATNTYTNVVDGLKLTIKQASGETVNVTVDSANSGLSASVKVFVENFNKYWDELTKDTAYDTVNNKPATLTGDSTAFSFETEMSNLLSGQFVGAGKITSLASIGITFTKDNTGHLQYDDTVLQNAVEEDPQAVQDFFTTKDTGFSAKVGALIEQLAGADKSMLSHRLDALETMIDDNNKRIDAMNARLDVQKEAMLMQFYNMELAIGNQQTNLKTLDSIQWMLNGNLFSTSNNNNSSN
jgi:flagellar capping protein FliD